VDRFGVELGKLGIESVRHWEIGKVKAEVEESEKVQPSPRAIRHRALAFWLPNGRRAWKSDR
jgi:hypothetical protein